MEQTEWLSDDDKLGSAAQPLAQETAGLAISRILRKLIRALDDCDHLNGFQ